MKIPQAKKLILFSVSAVFFAFAAASGLHAQTTAQQQTAVAPAPVKSQYTYKGIAIGSTADQVRDQLGEPKDKSDTQDLFVFSDKESAQFIYDSKGTVTAIVLTFSVKMDKAPTVKDVLGEDVPANEGGAIYKMVRYPEAGYWVSYNRIPGDDGIISIAMQKI